MFVTQISTFSLFVSFVQGQQDCSSSQEYYTAASDQGIFDILSLFNLNLWDGPQSFSGASTTQSTTPLTQPELMYYNYFAASVYCTLTLSDLSCCYCSNFNSTVTWHNIFENTEYGTKALVTLHPMKGEIVVTFRGSLTAMNWLLDFYFLQADRDSWRDIRIHRGNYLQLMSVYNMIVKQVGVLLTENPTYRVVIVGHSMGGAMASLFTFFLNFLDQFPGTNYALVTFGQPRTGNKGYVNYINSLKIPMARVVARADIVPHAVPVSAFGLLQTIFGISYLHHGQEVWIDGEILKFCSKVKYEDPKCSNSMGPFYSLLDHDQYFDADYTTCLEVGWTDFFTLPGLTPTNYIPPMPSKMQNYILSLGEGGYEGLLPVL